MYNFKTAEFMSIREKEAVLKNWVTFLKNLKDMDKEEVDSHGNNMPVPFKYFTDRVYKHLSLHCGFIAHYNRFGFYQTYFSGDQTDLEGFFEKIESWGDTSDLTDAMLAEYEKQKSTIFAKASEQTDDKFELLKECVKRAETDIELRETIINKFFN